jgi:hypothetical protein
MQACTHRVPAHPRTRTRDTARREEHEAHRRERDLHHLEGCELASNSQTTTNCVYCEQREFGGDMCHQKADNAVSPPCRAIPSRT